MKKSALLFLLLLVLGIVRLVQAQATLETSKPSSSFQGNILALSDADMIATAYADGISNKIAGIEDSLAYINTSGNVPSLLSNTFASNSVISWPAVLEWSPHRQFAYVAETRGVILPENKSMENVFYDYPKGGRLSVHDYQNPAKPVLLQDTVIGENLQNVSINHAGNLLAIGSTEKGKELIIARLKAGLIQEVFKFSDEEINYADPRDGGFRNVEFHPTENVIAVNLNGKSVAFYAVREVGTEIEIQKIGKSIKVGKKLSVGNWHPSGPYYLVSDVAWGSGRLGFVLNGKGKLNSIRFREDGQHSIISSVKVGLSPEGFDLSPDGRYALTVNMRRTYVPQKMWFVARRKNASLSLIKINPQTGELQVLGKEYPFAGILPEDAVFDAESNSIAVAVYQKSGEDFPKQGRIDFWEVQDDKLIKTNTELYLTRGVHSLLLVRGNKN